MHDTILKFGYPENLLKEYNNWVVLFRPKQVTVGSLILVCKEDIFSLQEMSKDSFVEMQIVIKDIEFFLRGILNASKINYLALMMVDKHVHFHIIPRYQRGVVINEKKYYDRDWPGPPIITNFIEISSHDTVKLIEYFKYNFWNE